MSRADLPTDIVRVNEIAAGIERRFRPDAAQRAAIARSLDLAALDALDVDMTLAPNPDPGGEGWRLTGRIIGSAVQTCGITLEPLPVSIDDRFSVDLIEDDLDADESDSELEIDLEHDAPDVIEDGRIDLAAYAVEQLSLHLDPFPRKPGAEFVQPEEPGVISPFAALKALKRPEDDGQG